MNTLYLFFKGEPIWFKKRNVSELYIHVEKKKKKSIKKNLLIENHNMNQILNQDSVVEQKQKQKGKHLIHSFLHHEMEC